MQTPRFLSLFLPFLALAGLPLTAAAQQSAPVMHVPSKGQSHPVSLPVSVLDKHYTPVTSLQKSDLTLTQDGRAQVITSFTTQSDLPLRLGLLIDTSHGMSGATEAVGKSTEKFVDQMLPATPRSTAAPQQDQAFLIHFDHEVELLRDFTPDRAKLHSELDELGPTPNQPHNDSQGPETTGDDRERPRINRTAKQLYDAIFLACDELMKSQTGRKALVVFSDGVDHDSKETLNDAVDAAQRANVPVYTIYLKGERQREQGTGFPGERHPVGMGGGWPGGGYPGGGYPGGGRRGESTPQVDGRKILEQIATRTGGRYFDPGKKENLDKVYNFIANDVHGQYLLTYTPDKPDNDGGFHKVALKVNKTDVTVAAPEGYYAPGGGGK